MSQESKELFKQNEKYFSQFLKSCQLKEKKQIQALRNL